MLHRFILDAPGDKKVDHINHDTLDNRRINLRLATNSENLQNRRGLQSNNKSGYRGVSFDKNRGKWFSYIYLNKKRVRLGHYDNKLEAAKIAYRARKENMPFCNEFCEELEA